MSEEHDALMPPPEMGEGFDENPPPEYSRPSPLADRDAPIPLGIDRVSYHFWSRVESMPYQIPKGMGEMRGLFLALSTEGFFYRHFAQVNDKGKKSINWSAAREYLVGACRRAGYYKTDSIVRGRGVFRDGAGVVANLGDELCYIDKSARWHFMPIEEQTRGNKELQWRYRLAPRLDLDKSVKKPLDAASIRSFEEALSGINFRHHAGAKILIGWIACGIIGGGLEYRPHCWVTGATATGKSWLMKQVMKQIFEGFCIHATAKTTEAGLRAALENEGIPVIFDEAESEDKNEHSTLQSVIALARQGFVDEGSKIIKGTSGGGEARTYEIRSCFLFSSINNSLVAAADRNRFLHLSLLPGKLSEADWQVKVSGAIKKLTHDTKWVNGFRKRAIGLAPRIYEEAERVAQRISDISKARRFGDTISGVIAAYSLMTNTDANELIDAIVANPGDLFEPHGDDATEILRYLFDTKLRAAGEDTRLINLIRDHERFVGANNLSDDDTARRDYSKAALRDYGITPHERHGVVYIRPNPNLNRLFADTRWAASWEKTILQHKDVQPAGRGEKIRVGGIQVRKFFSVAREVIDVVLGENDFLSEEEKKEEEEF